MVKEILPKAIGNSQAYSRRRGRELIGERKNVTVIEEWFNCKLPFADKGKRS